MHGGEGSHGRGGSRRRGSHGRGGSQRQSQLDEDPPQSRWRSPPPESEDARLASRMVRYVLAAKGRDEPLRQDKALSAIGGRHGSSMKQLLRAADHQLKDVFGMSLERLSNKRDLVLVNRLPVHSELRETDADAARRGLLVTILAAIYIEKDELPEDKLWNFLARLGVHQNRDHPCFGNVKKLVSVDFKRAGFLKTDERQVNGLQELLYHWGEGADQAVDKKQLLEFVRSIMGSDGGPELEEQDEEEEENEYK